MNRCNKRGLLSAPVLRCSDFRMAIFFSYDSNFAASQVEAELRWKRVVGMLNIAA
ncbi:hypothetical protein [Aminipila terrae]|uniref:Uncharacterized protein n=1 Tax=Aminipila terrae TaxID=2697030 RepID=A0A6P1MG13_9FIRM|nr:hypothetical protein [Aminipila terrae]QHI71524.1 hypothetical protein Ami3637_03225 [Aminipila terrae]